MIGIGLVTGLLMVVILLGYGMVRIPGNQYKFAFHKSKLNFLRFKVAFFEDLILEKEIKLKELISAAKVIRIEPEIRLFRENILDEI